MVVSMSVMLDTADAAVVLAVVVLVVVVTLLVMWVVNPRVVLHLMPRLRHIVVDFVIYAVLLMLVASLALVLVDRMTRW